MKITRALSRKLTKTWRKSTGEGDLRPVPVEVELAELSPQGAQVPELDVAVLATNR